MLHLTRHPLKLVLFRRVSCAFAASVAILIAAGCGSGELPSGSTTASLTAPDYKGVKKYFGYAEPMLGWQGTEVRFDVRHTHGIFSGDHGGNYAGTVLTTGAEAVAANVNAKIDGFVRDLGADDMYVQYFAGHGMRDRLGSQLKYDELRDKILAMRAKEIVILTMACHSGGLVESFNRKKEVWEAWQRQGRTLFVMSSSETSKVSATGPLFDAAEPVDALGSAGSRFGFALWKGLSGNADGYGAGGLKDDQVTLGELNDFVIDEVAKHPKNQHTPVVTGAFDRSLVMARSGGPAIEPSAQWLEARERLRPRLREIKVRLDAAVAAITALKTEILTLTAALTRSTPPLGLTGGFEDDSEPTSALASELERLTTTMDAAAVGLSSSVAVFAEAADDADPRMTEYTTATYGDERTRTDAPESALSPAVIEAQKALGAARDKLSADPASDNEAEASLRAQLNRMTELLTAGRGIAEELQSVQRELQAVADELSGLN